MDDATFNRKKAEQAQELARLVVDMRRYAEKHLKGKGDAGYVEHYLSMLDDVVANNPEESQAAIAGLHAMWHMLFGAANAGYNIHYQPKGAHHKADRAEVLRVMAELQKTNSKTKSAKLATERLDCSESHIWKKLRENKES